MLISKRIFPFVARWCTVVAALGFLAFYVWRAGAARRAESMMFASSKNARVLSLAAEQYFLESGAGVHPVASPVRSDPFKTPKGDAWTKWAGETPASSEMIMMGGSKSGMIVVTDFVQLLGVPADVPRRTFDLQSVLFSVPSASGVFIEAPPVRLESSVGGEGESPVPVEPSASAP